MSEGLLRRVPATPGPVAAARRRALWRVLRTAVRPAFANASLPVAARRVLVDATSRVLPMPRGARVHAGRLGDVACEHVTLGRPGTARHLLYLHGGGYALGSPRSHRALVARLAGALDATAHAVDYRRAPEHPHPAAVDDAVAAHLGLLAGGVDPATVVLAGDSAGGGLALATACRLRDEGRPLPGALVLVSPWVDLANNAPSHRARAARDPVIGDVRDWFRDVYLDGLPVDDPSASPLHADLVGLPPTHVLAGTEEVLLDDTTRLVARLAAAGVEVRGEVWEHQWHDFVLFAGLLRDGQRGIEHIAAFVDEHVPR